MIEILVPKSIKHLGLLVKSFNLDPMPAARITAVLPLFKI